MLHVGLEAQSFLQPKVSYWVIMMLYYSKRSVRAKVSCAAGGFQPMRCVAHRSALHPPSQCAAQAHAAHCLSRSGKMGTDKKHIISPPALHCHAPHPHPDRKRSVPRPPGHAFTPYKDRRPTSRLTSHHKKKQSFT